MSSSQSTSMTENELKEGDVDNYNETRKEQEEEIEDMLDENTSEKSSQFLQAALQQTRSRSSARSRSYTDGYSHFERDDDEEKQQTPSGATPKEGKDFEVQFDGDSDPMNPKSMPTWRKWLAVLIGSGCSLCVTCASALYTSTYDQLEKEFNISREVATVGLTTYVCGLGLGPMFLAPLSEFYGRRIIYLSAFGKNQWVEGSHRSETPRGDCFETYADTFAHLFFRNVLYLVSWQFRVQL